jgi:predicted transcriptional regulator YheO
MKESEKSAMVGILSRVGEALCRTIGPQCEVVIHDLADMEHSIVWIMGTVTERKVGGCMTSKSLLLVRSGDTQDNYNYTTRTRSGKLVRSSLVFVRDRKGRPVISVEINFDTSPFVAFQPSLEALTDPDEAYDFQDAFIDDAPEMLESMLQQAVGLVGKSVPNMSKADRLRVVQVLDEAGAFELRKAVPAVASYLDVTRFTIHNYLNEIREGETGDSGDGDGG